MLDLDRQRVTGQPFEQYVVPDSRAEFSGCCRRVRTGEGRRSCETRLLKHGHSPCDVLVEGTVAEGGSGQGHRCRLAVTDITERKRAEEKLRQFNTELEQHAAARTAELHARNEELIRFNRALADRELHMIELKKQLNELCVRLGQPARHPLDFDA